METKMVIVWGCSGLRQPRAAALLSLSHLTLQAPSSLHAAAAPAPPRLWCALADGLLQDASQGGQPFSHLLCCPVSCVHLFTACFSACMFPVRLLFYFPFLLHNLTLVLLCVVPCSATLYCLNLLDRQLCGGGTNNLFPPAPLQVCLQCSGVQLSLSLSLSHTHSQRCTFLTHPCC